jgi:predicted dehydrogenase
MDIDLNRARSLGERTNARYWTTDIQRVLDDPEIDLLFIASNHATHATYASEALGRGKHVHIEKPPAVDEAQLAELVRAMQRSTGGARLGFNRPMSRLGRQMLGALAKEQGPSVMNWFVAGHAIDPDHWYYSPAEGGRVLGNLCHWIDFTLRAVPGDCRWPVRIIPARSDRPDCNVAVTYVFKDGSIGVISFSAMGHTFEGVKERCTVQKGNALIALDDFRTLVIEVGADKTRVRLRHRDHGHGEAVRESLRLIGDGRRGGLAPDEVWETGLLALRTKAALESGKEVTVDAPHEYRDLEALSPVVQP